MSLEYQKDGEADTNEFSQQVAPEIRDTHMYMVTQQNAPPSQDQGEGNHNRSFSSENKAELGDLDQIPHFQGVHPITLPAEPQSPSLNAGLQKVIQVAYTQRKYLNQSEFQDYARRRNLYFQKHFIALDDLFYQFTIKIRQTTTFIPLLIKHFHQVSESHRAFIESCKNINVFKYLLDDNDQKKKDKHEWIPQFMTGVKLLMNLKDETSARHKTMDNYIVGEVVPAIERCLKTYTKNLQELKKQVQKHKDKYQDAQESTCKRIKKIEKMFVAEQNKKDWLAEELASFTEMQKSKFQLTAFGKSLLYYWKEIVKEEKQLASAVQKVVNQLLQNYKEVNSVSRQFGEYVQFWQRLNLDMEVETKYSLTNTMPLGSMDFMKSTLRVLGVIKEDYTFEDFDVFNQVKIQEEMFGNKNQILSSLIVKKFVCQREGQEHTHQQITIYSTADHYLVFFDERQPDKTNKMQIKRLMNIRKSQYAVNVNQKIEGFIMDSWNKEIIYFQSPDRAEEFMFHTQNNEEMKKSYLG